MPERTRTRQQPSIARVILAAVLLAMAAGQLADLRGFVEVLRQYDVGAALPTWVVAVGLVVGEAVGGVLLLRSGASARASGAVVALTVAIAWSALALSAFVRGEAIQNCGCFGVYLPQPLRWWVLLEDVEFVALGAWVLIAERGLAARRGARSRTEIRVATMQEASDVPTPKGP